MMFVFNKTFLRYESCQILYGILGSGLCSIKFLTLNKLWLALIQAFEWTLDIEGTHLLVLSHHFDCFVVFFTFWRLELAASAITGRLKLILRTYKRRSKTVELCVSHLVYRLLPGGHLLLLHPD